MKNDVCVFIYLLVGFLKLRGGVICRRVHVSVCHRSGQRRHSADEAGLQHGEGPIVPLAEEPEPAAARGRTDGLVRVQQEIPESQSPADL